MPTAPSRDVVDADDGVTPLDTLFATETMAELSARQGRIADAIAIYRHLLVGVSSGAPDDERQNERRIRWTARLTALVAGGEGETAPLPERGTTAVVPVEAASSAAEPPPRPPRPDHTLPIVVRQAVRSGQIVYAENNDLIVLGPVNPGAQLLADGNIHVYGALRGRAVAGARGAADAQVFCLDLQAELVGVDSGYVPCEEIPPEVWGKPARVWLREGRCVIESLLTAAGSSSKALGAGARFSGGFRGRGNGLL